MILLDDMTVPTIAISTMLAAIGALAWWLVASVNKRLDAEEEWRAKFLIEYNKYKVESVEKDNKLAMEILKEIGDIKLGAAQLVNDIKYRNKQ